MDAMMRIEQMLDTALQRGEVPGAPPRLAAAMRYAVFPAGHRIRPKLCLAVAAACGDDAPNLTDAAASAIEFLHCASLIHDDLPCFDDADLRRGKAAVHKEFGEPLAVLAGDALIVAAFEVLAEEARQHPDRLAPLTLIIARSVGMPHGIAAGQAWESEESAVLIDYQRAKTGSLFAAATVAGATAAGAGDSAAWHRLGGCIGEAYQVADDIRDAAATPEEIGKPVGQDTAHDRPSAALELGIGGAVKRLKALVAEATDTIPDCPGRGMLEKLIMAEASRFLPKELARRIAA
ncbi:MAG: polyprenyl synthetase family protein [Minwuia sp.]|uniref:polyprenyl synthetase family protein n=1 Tax=Minwuia sp. TaxID=2493630 RepID=UPI003A8AB9ED